MTRIFTPIFICLFLITSDLSAQFPALYDQAIYKYGKLKEGSLSYSFGDKVNMRAEPKPGSTVLKQLWIGEKVQIVERTEKELTLADYKENWYKISANAKDGAEIIGYVWGGLLAKATVFTDLNGDGKDDQVLIGVKSREKEYGWVEGEIRVKDGKSAKMVSSSKFRPFEFDGGKGNAYGYTFSAEMAPDLGFKNGAAATPVLRIWHSYEACDYPNGDLFLFWNGKKFSASIDAGTSGNEFGGMSLEFVWPKDEEGLPNTVKVLTTYSYNEDEEGNTPSDEHARTDYIWDGNNLNEDAKD